MFYYDRNQNGMVLVSNRPSKIYDFFDQCRKSMESVTSKKVMVSAFSIGVYLDDESVYQGVRFTKHDGLWQWTPVAPGHIVLNKPVVKNINGLSPVEKTTLLFDLATESLNEGISYKLIDCLTHLFDQLNTGDDLDLPKTLHVYNAVSKD